MPKTAIPAAIQKEQSQETPMNFDVRIYPVKTDCALKLMHRSISMDFLPCLKSVF